MSDWTNEGWESVGPEGILAKHLARVLAAMDPEESRREAVREAAMRLVEAELQGSTALDPVETVEWARRLAGSPALTTRAAEGEVAPLVLDHGRLYFHRSWEQEVAVARWLRDRVTVPSPEAGAAWRPWLDRVFAGVDPRAAAQRRAAEVSLVAPLAIIAGGPGTGKTSTVVRVLAAASMRALEEGRPAPRVVLAAPTGKAAQRMQEAIREGMERLDVALAVKETIPTSAVTLHRLLGAREDGTFSKGDDSLARFDLVVVDEASMVDLRVFARLVQGLGRETRLILLGDAGQLAPVEAGAVFAELHEAARRRGPVAGVLVELTEVFRFGAGLAEALGHVRRGDVASFLACCHASGSPVERRDLPAVSEIRELLRRGTVMASYRRVLAAGAPGPDAFAELARGRLLVPFHAGDHGRVALTAQVAAILGGAGTGRGPVIVTRNRPALGLSNGDVGLRDGQDVVFPEGVSSFRRFAASRLPPHEDAWVLTVHRSQGSEFGNVHLVLPPEDHPLLTRELLTTALSRARDSVLIWGTEAVIRAAIGRVSRRGGGLADRL